MHLMEDTECLSKECHSTLTFELNSVILKLSHSKLLSK